MGEWAFGQATDAMAEASAVLVLRDRVDEGAAALGLGPDDALRTAYESATTGLADAQELGQAELDALAAIEAARTNLAVEPDIVSTIGLLGETQPAVAYETARAAFERGDLDQAVASAAAATAILARAAAAGQQRILAAVGVAVAILLLVVVLAVARRRRRRHMLALAPAAPAFAAPAAEPAAEEPYATLAADPASPSAPPAANTPDDEGGPAPGEPPADR
jgi:hypothetical protein